MGTPRPNRKAANSLLALSSAAILGVYSAGYVRTRAAAQKFSVQSEARRPAPLESHPSAPVAANEPRPEPASPASGRTQVDGGPGKEFRKARRKRSAEAPVVTSAPAPAAPEAPSAPAPSAPSAPAPPAPAAPPAPSAPAAQYHDGTYFGWGTSRHGDIQAAVVIENGRIASATIAQCLTRYSCNVIARLPPQVSERQSPEVDYVSGATQSTNAFYYAVVEALGQAKAK